MRNICYYYYYLMGRLRRLYFMQLPESRSQLKQSRTWFIVDACTSVSILNLVGGAFLASLLRELKVSDAINGTVTSVVSLGALAQLAGAAMTKDMRKVKLFVSLLALTHRLMYALLFFIPFWPIHPKAKILLFIVIFTGAKFIGNSVNPSASSWLVSLVPASVRGKYMARRDFVSILCMMVITLGYSFILDAYKEAGLVKAGFQIGGLLVLILALTNFIALTSIREPRFSNLNEDQLEIHGGRYRRLQKEKTQKNNFWVIIKGCLQDRPYRKVLFMTAAWFAAFHFSSSYFGIYQVKELGLSYSYLMTVAFGSNLVRILITPYLGRYADKKSWGKATRNGLMLFGAAFFVNAFAVPANGKIVYLLFMLLSAVAAPGVNLGIFNLQFEKTVGTDKTPYIGLNSAIAGTVGFLSAIVGGGVLNAVSARSNQVFGLFLYGQQLLSFLSAAGIFLLVLVVEFKLVRNS